LGCNATLLVEVHPSNLQFVVILALAVQLRQFYVQKGFSSSQALHVTAIALKKYQGWLCSPGTNGMSRCVTVATIVYSLN
jgi:hypothetical protein